MKNILSKLPLINVAALCVIAFVGFVSLFGGQSFGASQRVIENISSTNVTTTNLDVTTARITATTFTSVTTTNLDATVARLTSITSGNATLNGTVSSVGVSSFNVATVTSTLTVQGATTLASATVTGTQTGVGLATFQTATVTSTALLGTSGAAVGVGTSTALLADLTVFSGSAAVSSTLQIGSSAHTNVARGFICLWNGAEYSLFFATSASAGQSQALTLGKATTTACNVIPAGL